MLLQASLSYLLICRTVMPRSKCTAPSWSRCTSFKTMIDDCGSKPGVRKYVGSSKNCNDVEMVYLVSWVTFILIGNIETSHASAKFPFDVNGQMKKVNFMFTVLNFKALVDNSSVVVVKWSACSPSTPTIRVRIPLRSTIFL